MKFAFGVPAWLGAIKGLFVMFGLPVALTLAFHYLLEQHLELSEGNSLLTNLGLFSMACLMWWSFVIVSARRRSKRK